MNIRKLTNSLFEESALGEHCDVIKEEEKERDEQDWNWRVETYKRADRLSLNAKFDHFDSIFNSLLTYSPLFLLALGEVSRWPTTTEQRDPHRQAEKLYFDIYFYSLLKGSI